MNRLVHTTAIALVLHSIAMSSFADAGGGTKRAGELERGRFVLLERGHAQLRNADGMEQARADARHVAISPG